MTCVHTVSRMSGLLLGGLWMGLVLADVSPFDEQELAVAHSPAETRELRLAPGERVLDFDVSQQGPDAYLLLRNAAGRQVIRIWHIGGRSTSQDWPLPAGVEPKSIILHPRGDALFVAGRQGSDSVILRVETAGADWRVTPIYRTPALLRRLVIGPRPFRTGAKVEHRLFFGYPNRDDSYAVRSITEHGKREYQVIGTQAAYRGLGSAGEDQPVPLVAPYALPMGFLPGGDTLLWQDQHGCVHRADYDMWNWSDELRPVLNNKACGGSLTATPNGLGLIHWRSGTPGVMVYLDEGRVLLHQATDQRFAATPSSVPDGRGLVGLTRSPAGESLVYVPIAVPLADVVNAWQFVADSGEAARLAERSGELLATDYDQMYQLYESELYAGDYESRKPARPYMVTTDVLWEVFAAAYEGLFVLQEKQHAMPAFWTFVQAVSDYYQAHPVPAGSPWPSVFATALHLHTGGATKDPELDHLRAGRRARSALFGREVAYEEAKPRSHYTMSPELGAYFMAFKYLTKVAVDAGAPLEQLQTLPAELKAKARPWLEGYLGFIAPPRRPVVWQEEADFTLPPYARVRPLPEPLQLFPLSWGFDNEVLLSTLYHPDWPPAEQIVSADGRPRLLPSGLDLAAALGSPLAMQLLRESSPAYPNLVPVLEELRGRYSVVGRAAAKDSNLYPRWLDALAAQWAAGLQSPQDSIAQPLWQAKRLQTGLASWTNLRHATLLVNERAGAEAGEGGFEDIVMRPPRGYVEPDPATFEAIAGLFDIAAEVAGRVLSDAELLAGVRRRLAASAAKGRTLAAMARKEQRGATLTPAEYEDILYFARVAEHHFLLYKALANPANEYAITSPNPMPKIADVAGGGPEGLLLSAVGRPLEWVQAVPYFGRRELVKGAVYSYYELQSPEPLDDKQWAQRVAQTPHPAWIQPWMGSQQPAP